jgi:hypothetical protein
MQLLTRLNLRPPSYVLMYAAQFNLKNLTNPSSGPADHGANHEKHADMHRALTRSPPGTHASENLLAYPFPSSFHSSGQNERPKTHPPDILLPNQFSTRPGMQALQQPGRSPTAAFVCGELTTTSRLYQALSSVNERTRSITSRK